MTADHLATTLAKTRLRERERCVRLVMIRAGEETDEAFRAVLLALADELRDGAGASRVAIVESATAAGMTVEEPADTSSLPPVRHHDDVDEGMRLARRHGSFNGG